MSNLSNLIGLGGEKISNMPVPKSSSSAGLHLEFLIPLLTQKNGFYAFESSLHVFAWGSGNDKFDLASWNSKVLWRNLYQELSEEVTFFAEDIFGGQFCLYSDGIGTFDPETGEISFFANTLEEWAAQILAEMEVHTGYPIAHEWQVNNGAIKNGYRLCPKIPFVLGGEFNIDNVFCCEAIEAMRFRASLANQIRNLEDGSSISIKFRE